MTNKVLSKQYSASEISVPAGYKVNPVFDFWLHLTFKFDTGQGILVQDWTITDSLGVEVQLSALTYHEVQFLANAMHEEVTEHQRSERYYCELEDAYYDAKTGYFTADRADEAV